MIVYQKIKKTENNYGELMNRRKMLRVSAMGSFILNLAPFSVFAQKTSISLEMEVLSNYMAEASRKILPDDVIEHTKHHLMDTLAAIISGSKLLPGKAAFKYINLHAAKGARTVIASNKLVGAADAALVNGVMGHADETDDSHGRSRSHPGCAVVPAALAAAEEFNVNGMCLLRSIALGYDVGTRLLMAMGGPKFSYSSHKSSHSIAGTFGAAASAACTANLNAEQMRWVLDYTAQQSSGIAAWGRDTDHIEKAFVFGGMPARNGVTSALLVQSGWNGIDDVFSGADNFFLAYAPEANKEILIEKLGERFEITQTDIKKWTVGSPIQGPLDAIEIIRSRHAFDANQVQKIVVRLEPSVAKVVDNREMPDICLQYMVSVMVLDRTATFKAAHDIERMRSSDVLNMRAKVQLIADEQLSQFLPVRVAIVEITLDSGEKLTERVEAVRGTPRNPMTKSEVVDKCMDLIVPILGLPKSRQLINTVYSIENLASVQKLGPLLQLN